MIMLLLPPLYIPNLVLELPISGYMDWTFLLLGMSKAFATLFRYFMVITIIATHYTLKGDKRCLVIFALNIRGSCRECKALSLGLCLRCSFELLHTIICGYAGIGGRLGEHDIG